jgi:hypothetical protein
MTVRTLRALGTMGVIASVMLVAGASQAAVTPIGSQATFNAAGATSQNTNFDWVEVGFFFPCSPYTVGDLTFVEGGQSLIGGTSPGTTYNTARSLFTDNFVAGTTVQIAGLHNLFAVNAGNFLGTGPGVFQVTTNLGGYSFTPTVGDATNLGPLTFVGFKAGAGEYFTSVNFSGAYATGVTDVQLGTAAAVPEPAGWALMLIGVGALGAALRRQRRALPAAA